MPTDTNERVAELVDAGLALDEIERELIDSAAWLDDDERAALWLFAWAYQDASKPHRRHGTPALVGSDT